MTYVSRVVSDLGHRLQARRQERGSGYALCPNDGFWFRPAYTNGKCPLCGEVALVGAGQLPLLRRIDRSWFGMGGLAIESLAMLVLVLVMYFKA